ncbi:MAG TPA: hypothetical protein VKY73_06845 [Polyangiaceae bacterium]|nr:hypothetical protein [Polyangiaceae bacterium]
MATLAPDSDETKRIDAALREWRQGDLALEEFWFVHVGDGAAPLTAAAAEASGGAQALTTEVLGLVVLTQTCDIVRSCVTRPYVEVAPLVRVSEDDLRQVKRGRRPAHATLPALEKDLLVADLDRVMTVEKSMVASWRRTPGFTRDADGRAFAQALARKRVRFAFPDDFTLLAKKLQARLGDKHDKNTDEGRGLRALREIRVCASPSWDAPSTEIFFWFIRDDADATFEGKSWADLLKDWLKLVPATGRFTSIDGQVATLQEMTAQDYVDSDPLDLDHLSTIGGE